MKILRIFTNWCIHNRILPLYAVITIWGAQAQADTEVYLSMLTILEDGLILGNPENISENPGYDNQPAFDPVTGILYYARSRDGQTDIAWMDLESGHSGWYSDTPGRSEYSPLRVPGTESISAIGLDTTGVQLLYSYSGNHSEILIPDLKVGYHLWVDADVLVCTVLIEDRMDLVMIQPEGVQIRLENNVGRSLHKIPGRNQVSYTKPVDSGFKIYLLDLETLKSSELTSLPEGVQDVCWLPDGSLLCGGNGVLQRYFLNTDKNWQVAYRFKSDFGTISRLALNQSGTLLALVVE